MNKLLIALVAVTVGYTSAFAAPTGKGRGGNDSHEPNAPKTKEEKAEQLKKDNQGGTIHASRDASEARSRLVVEAARTGVLEPGPTQEKAAANLEAALKDSSIGLTQGDLDLLYSRRDTQDGKSLLNVIIRSAAKNDLKGILTFYKKEYLPILNGKSWSAEAFKQLTEMLGRVDAKLASGDAKTTAQAIEEALTEMNYDKARIKNILCICLGICA